MKLHTSFTLGMAMLASLLFVPSADAQLWRWFGPKAAEKAPLSSKPQMPDERRVTEISVEVAWLADPVTFPYYLEAHATGAQLEVRGYVPSKSVREQAMRIAQVHSSLPVADSMKEHASLMVRPGQLSPQQLQTSVQSSLKVALPKQHAQLKVQTGADGRVSVAGPVTTYEEKLAVSHSLRRLHGCTSVQNLTVLPAELVQAPPTEEPRERTPIVKTSNAESKGDRPMAAFEPKARPWYWPFGKNQTTKDEPPLLDVPRAVPKEPREPVLVEAKKPQLGGPILIPDAPDPVKPPPPREDVVKVDLPSVPAKASPPSAAELQKRVKLAVPNVKSVEVAFTSATEVRIILEIRDEKELDAAAERVFAMPELEKLRADLQFKISSP